MIVSLPERILFMITTAIIAEYNPFHKGHRYQLKQTRLQTGTDFFLVIMSGDFVQRGAPAFTDKYLRTRMALLGGAHVVIELPALYALSSAEFFAQGAVTLLEQLHVADFLSFGSEAGTLSLFEGCASLLVQKEETIQNLIQSYLKKGYSFPAARAKAISELVSLSGDGTDFSSKSLDELFSSPNNILGIEYCKALQNTGSAIRPITIKRKGMGYHDREPVTDTPQDAFLSASALRKILVENPAHIQKYMAQTVCDALIDELSRYPFVSENTFSKMLHYKLLSEQGKGFCDYLDCSPSLSSKICKNLPLFESFSSFCHLLKSRELTYTRISRVLMHILLDIKAPKAFKKPFSERTLSAPYARLLGFRKSAAPLLSAIRKNSSIPLISKLADAKVLLDEQAFDMLKHDIYCADIYEAARPRNPGAPLHNEWKRSPVVIADL